MIEDNFIEKYTKDEKLKRGIESILKSDKYTDEYKALILKYLGENYSAPTEINTTAEEQMELMDTGGLVISQNNSGSLIISDKKPAVRGRLETPKYIESELVKAIDIVIDELISPPPKKSPLTVPLQTYLDLEALYSASVVETENFRERWLLATDELNTALAEIELLNQSLDACQIQRAVAENQADVINGRYITLLGDFQSAIQKGIQEAIERVSLTAQVRGLQAQKEALKAQLTLQTRQLEQTLLTKYMNSSIQNEVNNFAFKIPLNNIKDVSKAGFYYSWGETSYDAVNGQELVFYNFTTSPKTVSVTKVPTSVAGYTGAADTISVPTKFTIPAGSEYSDELGKTAVPGVSSLTIGLSRPGRNKRMTADENIRKYPNVDITFADNTGNKLVVPFSYRRNLVVDIKAAGNPGPITYKLDEGLDYTN